LNVVGKLTVSDLKIMDDDLKWDKRFLELAKHIASWSKDPSTQAGAVIVDDKRRVISVGFNGLARGVDDLEKRLHDRNLKYKMFVHCERNAIIFARQSLENCTLYTWPLMPCATCAAMVIQSGINRVIAPPSDNPRWQEDFVLAKEQFQESGVKLELLSDSPN
jgi:dCMP deaminase